MRKCKNCNCDMEEGYDVCINSVQIISGACIKKGKNKHFLLAAFCPKCEEIVLYKDNSRNKFGL